MDEEIDNVENDMMIESNIEDIGNMVFVEKVISYIYNISLDEDIEDPAKYREIFNILQRATEHDIINFYINSHGGILVTFVQLYNLLLNCKATTTAVIYTAHSVAALIALSCTKIIVTKFSNMMFHNSTWSVEGDSTKMKDHSDFFFESYKEILETVTRGFLTDKEIEKIMEGKEIWVNQQNIEKRLLNRDKLLKGKK